MLRKMGCPDQRFKHCIEAAGVISRHAAQKERPPRRTAQYPITVMLILRVGGRH
jgi:hypothetical protein